MLIALVSLLWHRLHGCVEPSPNNPFLGCSSSC